MDETVYRGPLGGLLTAHILLCFLVVGFITLPMALIRWFHRRLIVSDQAVSLQRGSRTNTIPINQIDSINVQRPRGRAGTLLISAGGVPTAFRVARARRARQDIERRILNARQDPQRRYPDYTQQRPQSQHPYPQYTRQPHLLQVDLLEEQPPLQQPAQTQQPYPQYPAPGTASSPDPRRKGD